MALGRPRPPRVAPSHERGLHEERSANVWPHLIGASSAPGPASPALCPQLHLCCAATPEKPSPPALSRLHTTLDRRHVRLGLGPGSAAAR